MRIGEQQIGRLLSERRRECVLRSHAIGHRHQFSFRPGTLKHRTSMFDFFKNLLSGKQSEQSNAFQAPPSAPAPAPKSSPAPTVRQRYPQPAAAAPRMPAPVSQPVADGNSVEIPVGSILVALPPELKTRVRPADIGTATFPVSLEQIFSQLASGSVKISFGELRQAMPQLFTNAADCDELPVALPLNEILGRVNPALLVRRPNQKQIEVPEEISSPFASPENGLNFGRTTTVDPVPAPASAPRATTPAAPAPNRTDIFQRKPAAPATPARPFVAPSAPATPAAPVPPAPAKPAARSATPVRPPVAPYAFQAPAAPVTPPQNPAPRVPVVPAKPAPVVPPPAAPVTETPVVEEPTSIPVSAALRSLESSIGMPAPKNNPAPKAAPASQAVPSAKPAAEVPSLIVPLISLTSAWPESLRQEISQLNLAEARVALPIAPVEEAMRRGKVHFPWTTIRSWITPAPAPAASAHDALVLELPLKVLMPLFMARFRGGKSQQKVLIDEKIPNLFFGFPQPDAPAAPAPAPAPAPAAPAAHSLAHPVAKPTETNYYVWEENSDSAKLDETEFKRKPVVETNFLSRHATPNEVVARAAALPGVIGALVALPDGLMVASKVPSDLNADTLAAFLPQIFGKVSQCTKELRMGDLNNLNFTVGNVPWKIFRVNAIFFAAFGCPGKGLPTAELATLAGQLDRKKQ